VPLDKVDSSPFCGFGDVVPGQAIQGLTNNLIRAPIFSQSVANTDFLLIRLFLNLLWMFSFFVNSYRRLLGFM
jgi:hypothetical protein